MKANPKSKPFLARYEFLFPAQKQRVISFYDHEQMIAVVDGKPAIFDPHCSERGTLITRVKSETTDDE